MGRKSPPSPKSPLKKLLMMPPMMPIFSVSRLMNTIIDATIIRSRMTSSRILSPKRAGCAVILVVSFLAPVSFFAVSLPALLLAVAFFTDGDFAVVLAVFFLFFCSAKALTSSISISFR